MERLAGLALAPLASLPTNNISISVTTCSSLPGGGSIEMTRLTGGSNVGYGEAHEADPDDLINLELSS